MCVEETGTVPSAFSSRSRSNPSESSGIKQIGGSRLRRHKNISPWRCNPSRGS